jgi:Tol biopolymer transport system component
MGRILWTAFEQDDVSARSKWLGFNDIWYLEAESKIPYRWIDDDLYKSQPWVSPDGAQIAYVASRVIDGQPESSVWIAEVDGTDPRRVSPTYRAKSSDLPEEMASVATVYITLSGWAADGRCLAYIVSGDSWGEPRLLFVIDVLTERVTRIEGDDTQSAVWSPQDPHLLVMNQFVTPYLVDVETGHLAKVDELDGKDIHAAWTPDGQHLFATVVDRAIHPVKEEGIIVVEKDTRTSRWLDVGEVWGARWSPDGRKIAYVSNVSSDKGMQGYSLLIMDSDTTANRVLVEQDILNVYAMPFSWSLDGQWIVGFGRPAGEVETAELYLVSVETGRMVTWMKNVAAPNDGKMVWCYKSHCVNGGYGPY